MNKQNELTKKLLSNKTNENLKLVAASIINRLMWARLNTTIVNDFIIDLILVLARNDTLVYKSIESQFFVIKLSGLIKDLPDHYRKEINDVEQIYDILPNIFKKGDIDTMKMEKDILSELTNFRSLFSDAEIFTLDFIRNSYAHPALSKYGRTLFEDESTGVICINDAKDNKVKELCDIPQQRELIEQLFQRCKGDFGPLFRLRDKIHELIDLKGGLEMKD